MQGIRWAVRQIHYEIDVRPSLGDVTVPNGAVPHPPVQWSDVKSKTMA